MNKVILFLVVNAIFYIIKTLIEYCIRRKREKNILIVDLARARNFWSIYAIVIIFASTMVYIIDIIAKNSAATYYNLVTFIGEEIAIFISFFFSFIYNKCYWGFEEHCVIKHPALRKEKKVPYDDVIYYTMETPNQITLHIKNDDKIIIPLLNNKITAQTTEFLQTKQIEYKEFPEGEKVTSRRIMIRKIQLKMRYVIAVIIYLVVLFYCNKHLFWQIYF